MTTLASDFEDAAKDALLDNADAYAAALGENLKQAAEDNFRDYANRQGYDIEHIWQDATLSVTRRGDEYRIEIEWPGLTALFEFGVDPHVIEGNPLLAFYWESPPQGTRPPGAPGFVKTQSVNWGSVTGGIDESRAIRGALDYIRFEESGEVDL